MKKTIKILALLLTAALLVPPLSGCGSSGGGQDDAEAASGEVWMPEFKTLSSDIGGFNCAAFSGDTAYIASTGIVSGASESTDALGQDTTAASISYTDAEPTIYRVSDGGDTCEPLPDYVPLALPEGSEGTTGIEGLCVDPDGNLWVYEDAYAYHYDLPEGFSGGDEEKAQYYVSDGQQYAIRKLGPTGAELLSVDLSELVQETGSLSVNAFVCDKDGNIYFSDGSTSLYVYDKTGVQLFTLDVQNWLSSLVTFSDGTVGAASYGQNGYEVIPVDVASKSWGTSIPVSYPDSLYSGSGDYYFFYTMSSSLYGYNKETGENEKLFGWLDCDIDQDTIRALAVRDDGGVLCLCSGDDTELVSISKQSGADASKKTTLTLATMYLDASLRKQILKFNKSSDTCRITVRDYSEYNTDGDYEAGLTKMSTEIIAGNVPDMLDISQLPIGQYVSRGLLEDLYPYIDADAELSRDSFVPSILKALEINGGLYQVSPGFGIFTVIGRSDVVGNDMGWTLDQMTDCLATQPAGTELFQQGITQDTMLQYICYMYMNDFVDWQAQTCNFDSPEFIKLLQFCAGFDQTFDYSEDTYESEVSRIQSGKQLLEITTETDFQSFQMYEAMFGGQITYKGFPCEHGVGNVAFTDSGLAMTTACKDKESAWSFMRTLLTEEYQESGDLWTFPINQAAFDKKLADAMTKDTYTDENGNEVEVSKGSWGWDDLTVDMYAVTEEQAARIKALIDSIDGVLIIDTNISDIIRDEGAAYFAGTKTAEEAAQDIQSRVSIYVSEQA